MLRAKGFAWLLMACDQLESDEMVLTQEYAGCPTGRRHWALKKAWSIGLTAREWCELTPKHACAFCKLPGRSAAMSERNRLSCPPSEAPDMSPLPHKAAAP